MWKKIKQKSTIIMRNYFIYFFFQIILPLTDFLLSHLIAEEYKIAILIIAFTFPILVIFPMNLAMVLYRENKMMKELARIYKSVVCYLRNIEYLRDEHLRTEEFKITFKIEGSDTWVESRVTGFNNHPESKDSSEIKLFSAADAPFEGLEIEIHDNIRDVDIEPEQKQLEENLVLYKVKYPPLKAGEHFDFSILRHWPGCIVKREEYIFVGFRHLLRGVKIFYGEIIFDREISAYYATTISNNGNIEKINIDFNYSKTDKKLSWKIDNPSDICIINFVIPKFHSTKKVRS